MRRFQPDRATPYRTIDRAPMSHGVPVHPSLIDASFVSYIGTIERSCDSKEWGCSND